MKKAIVLGIMVMLLFNSCEIFNPKIEERVEMILLAGGTFTMGDVWEGGYENEIPTHEVTLSSYYIGKYEVTQALYEEIMGNNPSCFSGDTLPVEQVTWYDAIAFCNKLSDTTGFEAVYIIDGLTVTADFTKNGYRLPTEAEWEYAARSGGRDDRKYSGTNIESEMGDYVWYYSNSDIKTHEVGAKQANDLGIYDMSGNVWEWCWDWYGSYSSSSQTNPTGPSSGSYRVDRGGSWLHPSHYCRTALRSGYYPPFGSSYSLGFRLARNGD